MNSIKNRVLLVGHLGQNPETKTFENGKSVTKFSLATNDSYKNEKGEYVTETQWHNLVAWGSTAKIAENYLDKGKEVVIEGKLTTRNYLDKEGNKKYITEVVVSEIMVLAPKTQTAEKADIAF